MPSYHRRGGENGQDITSTPQGSQAAEQAKTPWWGSGPSAPLGKDGAEGPADEGPVGQTGLLAVADSGNHRIMIFELALDCQTCAHDGG
mmetsp:Transcript_32431/g.50506  ORF Transcript_32431/g.50506 Transcript_32431/m.50506 type:complete len:89 (-) Transcript_32431:276-542(-)